MNLSLIPWAVCRVPAFHLHETLEDAWEELKGFIKESSPEFYLSIQDCRAGDIPLLDYKTRFTVEKYFNRARTRSTPYGQFASFSLIPLVADRYSSMEIILGEPFFKRMEDWSAKDGMLRDAAALVKQSSFFVANSTIYLLGEKLKYLFNNDGQYELSSVDCNDVTFDLIKFCRSKRSKEEVMAFLFPHLFSSKKQVISFIKQLVGLQLLLSDQMPNITGPDFFERVFFKHGITAKQYILNQRPYIEGQLSIQHFTVLKEATTFLHKHLQPSENFDLKEFKKKFAQRFENREVPLAVALDPQAGIGYGNLEQAQDHSPLVNFLKESRPYSPDQSISYKPLHQFLLNRLIEGSELQLAAFSSEDLTPAAPLPNTFSALVQVVDTLIVVDHIGGCTANALIGRFSMGDSKLENHGRSIAEIEQTANPGVIFFDIAYQGEKQVDNINRRKLLYPYEFTITGWPMSEGRLQLDDMWICLRNNELILYSRKAGKRLIPRLATAYNYVRADLGLFRFLSDLQHQNICSSLSLSLPNLFPGLKKYPRVLYRNVVLSVAKYLVPAQYCYYTEIQLPALLKDLPGWLSSQRIRFFKCGHQDQKLLFDANQENDLKLFLAFSKNKNDLHIEEAFVPDQLVVKDSAGNGFLSEILLSFSHSQTIYRPIKVYAKQEYAFIQKAFFPGSEWIYFELYCHPSESDIILVDYIHNFVLNNKKKIKKFFFIRYNEPEYHIRFRVQLLQPAEGFQLIHSFSDLIAPLIREGIIHNYQLKPYIPETERYGEGRMEQVEKYFCSDSTFILGLLKIGLNTNQLYWVAIGLVEDVLRRMGYSYQQKKSFIKQMCQRFALEFNLQPEGFKTINKAFREFNAAEKVNILSAKGDKNRFIKVATEFLSVIQVCQEPEREHMVANLFHMHINRLFKNDQRLQELIIYHFLASRLEIQHNKLSSQEKK